jgi:hypothetical protein
MMTEGEKDMDHRTSEDGSAVIGRAAENASPKSRDFRVVIPPGLHVVFVGPTLRSVSGDGPEAGEK